MAHLPNDELPSEFDVIVVGTGLTQSVLAAAAARVGKAVLHLDGNSYYGGYWATLMYNDLERWIDTHSSGSNSEDNINEEGVVTPPTILNEGEMIVDCNVSSSNKITNLVQNNCSQKIKSMQDATVSTSIDQTSTDEPHPSLNESTPTNKETIPNKDMSSKPTPTEESTPSNEESTPTNDEMTPTDEETTPTDESALNNEETMPTDKSHPPSLITWDDLGNQKRRFNFDLIPKLLYCRGRMVDAITQSGVSRYIEFRSIPKLYSYSLTNDKLVQVPCSRADVFTSTIVTMLEKRKLMKVLTFCAEYDQHPSEYQEFIDRPFIEFLRSRDLTENIVQFILHSIAMISETDNTLKGLKASQVFLQSLGRFGNAPFLFPLFGGGELPQGFARLCAVFGGVYCLKRSIKELIISKDNNQLLAVICTTGQRIKCSALIGPMGLLKREEERESNDDKQTSRAMYVTNGPINGIDEKIALLTILPEREKGESSNSPISVLQLDNSTLCAAEGYYLIHATCTSYSSSAENDLKCVEDKFFTKTNHSSSDDRPRLLWSLYYNMNVSRASEMGGTPKGIVTVSDPNNNVSYEDCIEEAKKIFEELFPNEEFLPKMPDAEDIIYGEEENNTNEENNEEDNDSAPTDNDTNEKEEVAPTNNDTNEKEEVAPTNNDTNEKEDFAPTNNDTNEKEEVAPTNNDTNEKVEVAPANNDTNEKEVTGNDT